MYLMLYHSDIQQLYKRQNCPNTLNKKKISNRGGIHLLGMAVHCHVHGDSVVRAVRTSTKGRRFKTRLAGHLTCGPCWEN